MFQVQGKRISILGAGESGIQSALFLKKRGAAVFLSELKEAAAFGASQNVLKEAGIDHEFGSHHLDRLLKSELIIISPGIPPKAPVYQKLVQAGIPIWSEIELAFRFTPCPVVAITGSAGKTTTTTLAEQVFRSAGYHAVSCGNIGNSFIREVEHLKPESIVILEISSFQLVHTEQFRPQVGILLNLSANHFDWHGNFDAYADAKWRIFKNQTKDQTALLNSEDQESRKRAPSLKSQTIFFSGSERFNPNEAAVKKLAELYHISEDLTDRVFRNFKGIEHRLEEVAVLDGVRFINDSKSTTIASLTWALSRMETPTVLIAGGRHKGGDFSTLKETAKKKLSDLIVIGEARPVLKEVFADVVPVEEASSLEEALQKAKAKAKSGQTVLFSPACASFDMFQNYEDRGRQFKALVQLQAGEVRAGNDR